MLKYAESYSRILRRLIAGDVPAVTHCSAGRDPTSVYNDILVTALGVPWDVVVENYLLTIRYWLTEPLIRQRQAVLQQQYGLARAPDAAAVRALYTLDASLIERMFDTIRREYGSFDAFRRTALNISDRELATLRARFLELSRSCPVMVVRDTSFTQLFRGWCGGELRANGADECHRRSASADFKLHG